jgi:hypothetical protein
MPSRARTAPRLLLLGLTGMALTAGCSGRDPAASREPAATDSPAASSMPPASPAPAQAAGDQGTFVPDADETAQDLLAQYGQARALIASGQPDEADSLLRQAIARYPESRHLRELHADLLWQRSGAGKDRGLLEQAAREGVRAAEIGLRHGQVDAAATGRLAEILGLLEDRQELDRIFPRLTAASPEPAIALDYARALARMDDPRAEAALKKAAQRPDDDAFAAYAEWLLDHRRDSEALSLLPTDTNVYYLRFLRGVALERLGRTDEAKAEYGKFARYSATFPAPARFKIPGSEAQASSGIRFAAGN